jgi:hypothetical protein
MVATAPLWPAPPADGVWPGLSFRVPPVRSATSVRITPPRPKPQPQQGLAPLNGVALHFCRWMIVAAGDPPQEQHVYFEPGCADRSLARIAAGTAKFSLWQYHNRRRALVTADESRRCLRVWRDGAKLRLHILPFTRAGREAIRDILDGDARALSVGGHMARWDQWEQDGETYCIVKRFILREVSIVRRGGCPGARLFLK